MGRLNRCGEYDVLKRRSDKCFARREDMKQTIPHHSFALKMPRAPSFRELQLRCGMVHAVPWRGVPLSNDVHNPLAVSLRDRDKDGAERRA